MKAILAKRMRLGGLDNVLKQPLRKYAGLAAKAMEDTTANFRVTSPNFQSSEDFDQGMVFIGPVDNADGQIWFYLDKGTAVRYATMTPGYQAGTTPGSLGTTTAQGGVAYINTNQPRPGIAPREWTTLISNDLGPKFQQDVEQTVQRFIARIY